VFIARRAVPRRGLRPGRPSTAPSWGHVSAHDDAGSPGTGTGARPGAVAVCQIQGAVAEGAVDTSAAVEQRLVTRPISAAVVEAVLAGCDALLYPEDTESTIATLAEAVRQGALNRERVREAVRRLGRAAARVGAPLGAAPGRPEDLRWAFEVAVRTIHVLRGEARLGEARVHLVELDDDQGGPHPAPPRTALKQALHDGGVELAEGAPMLLALYADVRAWKGRAGLSAAAIARASELLATSPEAVVVLFGHPRQAEELPAARNVVVAWGGEPLMQRAAAAWLLAGRAAG